MVSRKPYAAEPLRLGQSLGAALAFAGVAGAVPVMIGAQGCAIVAHSLLARHFRRPLAIRSVALNEVSLALGGNEPLFAAVAATIRDDAPELIGLIGSGLSETRGDDPAVLVALLGARHPERRFLPVATPDFKGSLEDGWSLTVTRLIEAFAEPSPDPAMPDVGRASVAILPASFLTPADIEAIRELAASLDLDALILPDLSGALERHRDGLLFGRTRLADIARLGSARLVIGLGAEMRGACERAHRRCGMPFEVIAAPFGLAASDRLVELLLRVSGRPAPAELRRDRDRLIDVMADAAGLFAGVPVAVAGEHGAALALAAFVAELGARCPSAVVAAMPRPAEPIAADRLVAGDYEELEGEAAGSALIIAPNGAEQVAARLGIPLVRQGLLITDRLDTPFRRSIGYDGAIDLAFRLAEALYQGAETPRHPPLEHPHLFDAKSKI